jgi:predicted Zn-dependent peptidase
MIEQTTVDGIPTLLAPGAGPTRGGITFRVGHADETLARSGITHLVEHLALHRLGMTDYHYNGATGSTVTHFFSQGAPEDVGSYLRSVCDALVDLPWHRLANEKEILRTEAAGKSNSVTEPLLLWRYGARSYGLASYPEWGLAELTADDVRAWVARHFTRDNAVLWFGGTPPTDLALNLPPGTRMPLPETTSALPHTPAFFAGPARAVALHTVVPRSMAAQVFSDVLERELFRALRQEGGYSYTAATSYDPVDREVATIVALADAHQDNQDAALGGFIDVLAKLRWGRIEQRDIDATLAKGREALRDPDADQARLPAAAFGALIGAALRQSAELLTDLETVTVDALRPIAETAANNALLMVPEGRSADWAGFVAAPTTSTAAVVGTRYPMRNDSEHAVIIGADGVSLVSGDAVATVHFAQCAVLLAWPDGGRMLIGDDALAVRLEPTVYAVDPAALRQVDEAMPGERLVRLPARNPDSIPKPPAPKTTPASAPASAPAAPAAPARKTRFLGLTVTLLVLLGSLTLGCTVFSAVVTGVVFNDPEFAHDPGSQIAVLVVFWGATAFAVTMCVLLARRARRAWRS